MSRERLPNRRPSVTESLVWGGDRLHVSGAKVGSERDHQLADVAVTVSRLLQHGDTLTDIARGVGRLPFGEAASVVGAVIDKLHEIEGDLAGLRAS